jgi:uncharacterized protein (TIGR00375 family)
MGLAELYALAARHGCQIVPAHIFTPFKSIYGNCAARLSELFPQGLPPLAAVELGLSADAAMADRIGELRAFPYLANSDAHSPQNIAREFTELALEGTLDFRNIFAAVEGKQGQIKTLYGLHPALGKYHLTRCARCGEENSYGSQQCARCGGRVVPGVSQRIGAIADFPAAAGILPSRSYKYHFPLAELPGVGAKTLERIYCEKLTELDVLWKVDIADIENTLGRRFSELIKNARAQKLRIHGGGAGQYGYVIMEKSDDCEK